MERGVTLLFILIDACLFNNAAEDLHGHALDRGPTAAPT
jgi:hypothetical protein